MSFSASDVVEKEANLKQVLQVVHGVNNMNLHVGPVWGDVMIKPLCSWNDAHGLVVGPPCPPWSLLGKKGGTDDERAGVFEKMMDLIIDLAGPHRKIRLRWFIIENVTGLTKKVGGKDPMIWHV